MPNRILREGFRDSESISALSDGAESLYVRLLLSVDDFGRFDARPGYIKSQCYPTREVSLKEVSKRLTELAKTMDVNGEPLVTLYIVNGRPYLVMHKFGQRLRAMRSKWPAPPETPTMPPESGPADLPELPDGPPAAVARGPSSSQQPGPPAPDPVPDPVLPPKAYARAIAAKAVDYLNAKAGTKYRHTDGTLRLPIARVIEGATEADLLAVIDHKVAQAAKGDFDRKYLRPETLFNATKFASYIGQLAPASPLAHQQPAKVTVRAWADDPAKQLTLCELQHNGDEAPELIASRIAGQYTKMIDARGLLNISVFVPGMERAAVFSIDELREEA